MSNTPPLQPAIGNGYVPLLSLCPQLPPSSSPPTSQDYAVSDYSRISGCYSSTVLKCLLQNRSSITESVNGRGGQGSDGEVNEGLKI